VAKREISLIWFYTHLLLCTAKPGCSAGAAPWQILTITLSSPSYVMFDSGAVSVQPPTSGVLRLSDLVSQRHPGPPRRLTNPRNSPTESLANMSQISTLSSRTTSQEITTLRPRSGKEYQRINRRRLGSASGSDTSPLTLSMTPHSPGSASMKTQVFTFDDVSRSFVVGGGPGTDSPRSVQFSRGRLSTSAASHAPEPASSSPEVQCCFSLLEYNNNNNNNTAFI